MENYLTKAKPSDLKRASEFLSKTYANGLGSSSIFDSHLGRLAYLSVRMPAIFHVIKKVLLALPGSPRSWIDLGAGPGTASWAAHNLFPESDSFTLVEKNQHAINLGKELFAENPIFSKMKWISASLPIDLPPADAAIFSYSLGELDLPSLAIKKWWDANISFLVLIEPGTPRGFSVIRKARDQILSLGGFLIAPCPHALECPLKTNDWCHFSERVARDRLHRYLKGAALGYEDEKYSYLIVSKNPVAPSKFSRALRKPQKHSGHVRLSLCTDKGTFEEVTIGRSNKKFYKTARSLSWGDKFDV